MNKIFSIDGGFYRFMSKIADIIILNFLVLICTLPVITVGPALIAMFYVTLKLVRDEEGGILKDFFKSFRRNFIQGVIVEILVVAIIAFFAFDIYTMYNWMQADGQTMSKVIFAIIAGLATIVGLGIIFLFPLIAKFDNKTFMMFKNSIAMAISNLPYSLLMAIIYIFAGLLVYVNPFCLMFAIGAAGYINSYVLVKIFDKYIPKEEEPSDEEATEGEPEQLHITITEDDTRGNV